MNFIFGLHSVEALTKNSPGQIEIVYIDSHRQDKRVVQLVELLDQATIKYEYISKNILDKNH
jgi:tRNA G18 (ribose-2'-O)-methylase SpoU